MRLCGGAECNGQVLLDRRGGQQLTCCVSMQHPLMRKYVVGLKEAFSCLCVRVNEIAAPHHDRSLQRWSKERNRPSRLHAHTGVLKPLWKTTRWFWHATRRSNWLFNLTDARQHRPKRSLPPLDTTNCRITLTFSRCFYPKWLTISTFVGRKRNDNIPLSVHSKDVYRAKY
jgi:hypothetical protein